MNQHNSFNIEERYSQFYSYHVLTKGKILSMKKFIKIDGWKFKKCDVLKYNCKIFTLALSYSAFNTVSYYTDYCLLKNKKWMIISIFLRYPAYNFKHFWLSNKMQYN